MAALDLDRFQSEANPETVKRLLQLRERRAELDRQIAAKSPVRPRPWHEKARPDQLMPKDATCQIHLFMAGRGWGKSATGSNWLAEQAATNPNTEWAVVAPVWRDCRKVCIEGPTGILAALLPGELDSVNASDLTVRLTNGSRIYGYSGDRPDRLRGANLSGAWIDEFAAIPMIEALWREALIPALRIGERPQVVITTTPKPVPMLRKLLAREDGSVRIIRGATFDNAANLSKAALAEMKAQYEGTRLGRQELHGELIDDVDGALWTRDMLDASRVLKAPTMARIVVAIDPAVTSGENSDSTGIIVAGRSQDGHFYVLEDLTMKGSPHQWARTAIKAYEEWNADRIVGEVNNGGDLIEQVLRTANSTVAYKSVRATRGKLTRAEPISQLWERGTGHIVCTLPELEDQMCNYTPDSNESPDRMDAMVWAGHELQMGSSAMIYLSAITKLCMKCDMPNKKVSTVCRGCGAQLPEAA